MLENKILDPWLIMALELFIKLQASCGIAHDAWYNKDSKFLITH